jgi:hypothetical protein
VNQHLSDQEIDGWVIGERSPRVEIHLQSCQDCAVRVAQAAEPLTLFRGAVRSWGEEQMNPLPAVRLHAPATRWRWQIALAIATLCLLLAVPFFRHRQVTREAALTKAQDELLLQEVEQELSRKVPAPMEPLAKLMTNDLSR